MRTDPRAACGNENEKAGWAFLHDLVAHPFMAITRWSQVSLAFHDWTSNKAWPRKTPFIPQRQLYIDPKWGNIWCTYLDERIWELVHPNVRSHSFRCQARDVYEAVARATKFWEDLAEQHAHDPQFQPQYQPKRVS